MTGSQISTKMVFFLLKYFQLNEKLLSINFCCLDNLTFDASALSRMMSTCGNRSYFKTDC